MRPLYYELRLQKTPARQILLVYLAGVKWFRSKALILILVENLVSDDSILIINYLHHN